MSPRLRSARRRVRREASLVSTWIVRARSKRPTKELTTGLVSFMFGKFIAYAVPIALISLVFGILALAAAGEPTDITFLAALLFGFAFGLRGSIRPCRLSCPQFGAILRGQRRWWVVESWRAAQVS